MLLVGRIECSGGGALVSTIVSKYVCYFGIGQQRTSN